MNLEFVGVDLVNFKSFIGEHSIDLADRGIGLHFLRGRNKDEPELGSNGAGKTTVWDAVCWCLYGKTPSGLKNPDVRPWNGKGRTWVGVEIRVDDKAHLIERAIGPNSLLIDAQESGPEAVERLIGLDFDLFTNTILLGQGRPLFFDLQPRAKMQLFVTALNLDRWDERAATAGKAAIDAQSNVSLITGTRMGLDATIVEVERLLETAKTKAASWDEDRQDRLKASAAELERLQENLEILQNNKGRADLAYDGSATEMRALEREIPTIESALLAADRKYQAADLVLDNAKQRRKRLTDELNGAGTATECPTCGQSFKDAASRRKHAKSLSLQILELNTEITAGVDTKLVEAVENTELALNKARDDLAALKKAVNDAQDAYDANVQQCSDTEARIVQLKTANQERETEINPHSEQVRTLRKRRKALLADYEDTTDALKAANGELERNRFWARGFKEVRLYIMEEVLQELELTTERMLEESGLIGWRVAYNVESETQAGTVQRGLSIAITSPRSSASVKWESWSGGEGQRLRVVGALALSEVLLNNAGVTTNMEVLDEPTQHLSTEGVRDLCELLAQRARDVNKQIWYIDHQSVESAHFTSVLTVVKNGKGSAFV